MLEANRQLLTGRLEVAADGPHLVMPMLASHRGQAQGQCQRHQEGFTAGK